MLKEHETQERLRYLSKNTPKNIKVLLPAIKPSVMMIEKVAKRCHFEEVPLAELLHFIADLM